MVEGSAYFFTIKAILTSGSIAAYPHLSGNQWAFADAITSGVTP